MMRLESVLLLLMVPGVICLFAVPPSKSGQDQFELLLPAPVVVRTGPTEHESGAAAGGDGSWLSAVLAPPGVGVLVGSRMVLRLEEAGRLEELLAGRPLTLARQVDAGTFILQTTDAWTALNQAQDLGRQSGVLASHPVMRHSARLHGRYHRQPNDSYFSELWHLENRESDGKPAGADLNSRAAWPLTRGAGTLIAVADDGVEFTHPDLEASALDAPHFDFESNNTNGLPPASWSAHGTAVAGLIAATMNNRRGTAGVAPEASVASWVIFGTNDLVDDEALMDMYQYRSNMVSVQNHSWGFGGVEQLGPSLLEEIGISNAVTSGRDGLGVVMVRSGGNSRTTDDFGGPARGNANNDGYVSDSRVIGVGAVRSDGRVSSYSNPGSALLVAAPGGDVEPGARTLFTTDRIGSLGYNQNQSASNDLGDYAFDETGFIGTSGAAPQVSAIAALILSVNPSLHYRDVQHILLLSARHFDLADPDVSTNAAGLRVSHNVGFGIPDAGRAVRLAEAWTKRPPATQVTYSSDEVKMVPEDAMRVHVSGSGLPSGLTNLVSRPPIRGPRADVATAGLPLVDLGLASEPVAMDLTGRAALIRRGENFFQEKIGHAASAGASFAIIYNNTGQSELVPMDISEFTPIPAVFIGQTDGEALQQRLLDGLPTWAGLHLEAARYNFEVTETLLCEHVSVTVRGDHSSRGDLRITLISPQGTRSILQHENFDVTPGPAGWTYFTTHHFHESSAGTWTVQFSDEVEQDQGSIQEVDLMVSGTLIEDTDRDGLHDPWEMARFGTLDSGPADDPDADGYSNSVEYILNTDPTAMDVEFRLDLSSWNSDFVRLSWQGKTNQIHDIYRGDNVTESLTWITNLAGSKPEIEWFTPVTNVSRGFFRVRSTPAP